MQSHPRNYGSFLTAAPCRHASKPLSYRSLQPLQISLSPSCVLLPPESPALFHRIPRRYPASAPFFPALLPPSHEPYAPPAIRTPWNGGTASFPFPTGLRCTIGYKPSADPGKTGCPLYKNRRTMFRKWALRTSSPVMGSSRRASPRLPQGQTPPHGLFLFAAILPV